ncbi:hypothetical protein [Gillisia limnaea]|uniref:Uncharacterized protein n=1 Tax=Gillisia limnaea (strain DSM 15749 / LMG 21470 / R-8282) TaxID=865937 RepID=H2BW11_GILLR|nr:hypothetical protein [Gillisia limnaea]EHQ02928.1 hypothetical protein Gilli_2297 [Gillisia limnaea DSM 15749]
MKHFYFAVLFLLFTIVLPAQVKDLEQEIMNYQESRSQLISKGRRLLLDKFMEGDIEKVKEVKDYLLNEVQNEDYVALFPGEVWMIMYWTGEHEDLPGKIVRFERDSMANYQRKIFPDRDLLYTKLIERSWEQLQMLEDKILDSSLDTASKDFLLLHLNFMVSGEPLMKLSQEEVNMMADLYLETHPESPYEDYLRNNIRYRYAPSKWAFGFEFFSGFGMFTGELGEMYNNHGVFGVAFDVEYNKFTLYLRNYIGFAKTKQDRENGGVFWSKDSPAMMFFPEASLGYAVVENDKIKLSPFAGIGAANIGPVTTDLEQTPELEALEVGFAASYTLGLNLNIKLGWDTNYLLTNNDDKSYWYLRLRYGYTMPQFNDYPMHSGNVHHLTIGFGGVYRGMKRSL